MVTPLLVHANFTYCTVRDNFPLNLTSMYIFSKLSLYIVYSNKNICSQTVIAERLSARLLIVQCSQFAFVCMYVCIYIRHTLIAWARFLRSRPQTTSHVVLVRSGGDRRVKKIVQEPKWSRNSPSVIVLESENGNKGTLHQKRVRQRIEEEAMYTGRV